MTQNTPIIALASPYGAGAIAVIRLCGDDVINLCHPFFHPKSKNKDIRKVNSHTLHFGMIVEKDRIIDQVILSLFKKPNSYTGEETIEISCHGSTYIQQEIIQLFLRNGFKMAEPGEFTLRAFLNGKLDLSQAEAVSDLIASDSETSHKMAIEQMRGGFSSEIKKLRQELLNFASLIELELDFSQEDVEFADRNYLKKLVEKIKNTLEYLTDSFALGNVMKNGIPVAIIGAPNSGKSTLLNILLNEERAIVSPIAGTTRDVIEDQVIIGGISFRFIDTAGIRETKDSIEKIGVQKTFKKIEQANIVLYMIDTEKVIQYNSILNKVKAEINKIHKQFPDKKYIMVANKIDLVNTSSIKDAFKDENLVLISAKKNKGIKDLTQLLLKKTQTSKISNQQIIVTNNRHYHALTKALNEMYAVSDGLNSGISADLLSIDIRQALYYLGEITGDVSNYDLLNNIFSNFCIGK